MDWNYGLLITNQLLNFNKHLFATLILEYFRLGNNLVTVKFNMKNNYKLVFALTLLIQWQQMFGLMDILEVMVLAYKDILDLIRLISNNNWSYSGNTNPTREKLFK